ncbi:MAG: methylenetetrahydrofolate--tRNA-(uracil(54)-C(5))-methyltransferase (FADH(2)-oxidizing) TrmFO [Candidatus Wallbacteria bacterium]|nr:methylenetetrahydrofolate--tRNA-(uracil(54)-C(5))-methyltransferase (FADH(2)-oxidizing) TrmFO [Candidatus Wallbacteria bacterium]
MAIIDIIGGGLAGCEAAWQLCRRTGHCVRLREMRPLRKTPAHKTGNLAELVCSNSLHSENITTASGILKRELLELDSLIISSAMSCRVRAGSSLSVDRALFSETVESRLKTIPRIEILRSPVDSISDISFPAILATGPLFEGPLFQEIMSKVGEEKLYFYDAVSPTVSAESIDMDKAFWGNRYDESGQDYLNLPLTAEQYQFFREALVKAETWPLKDFERSIFFESCLPVEEIARRGEETLCFGPLRPVGLTRDRRIKAVIQLRLEDGLASAFNLVGFQTNLLINEQKRVFRMIPGLEKAEFLRFGKMHRNTYLNSPLLLNRFLEFKDIPGLFLAGQLTGVEGYCESAATGLCSALFLASRLAGCELPMLPDETMLGSLLRFLRTPQKRFMPMNSSFGLLPPLPGRIRDKKQRKLAFAERSENCMPEFIRSLNQMLRQIRD